MPTSQTERQLPLQVLRKFRLIYGNVRQHFRQIEHACGISGSQLWVLQEVARQPGIGISALAECISIHQSTCSQIVDKLVASGMLLKLRQAQDQRRVGLNLSEQAQALLASAPAPAEGLLPQTLMHMTPETLQLLDVALSSVIKHLPLRNARLGKQPLADL